MFLQKERKSYSELSCFIYSRSLVPATRLARRPTRPHLSASAPGSTCVGPLGSSMTPPANSQPHPSVSNSINPESLNLYKINKTLVYSLSTTTTITREREQQNCNLFDTELLELDWMATKYSFQNQKGPFSTPTTNWYIYIFDSIWSQFFS